MCNSLFADPAKRKVLFIVIGVIGAVVIGAIVAAVCAYIYPIKAKPSYRSNTTETPRNSTWPPCKDFEDQNDENATPILPNIGYLGRGYDVAFANPRPSQPANQDPGFRLPIFQMSRFCGKTTSDGSYRIPEGIVVIPSKFCDLTFGKVELIDSSPSYVKLLSEAGYYSTVGNVAFTASDDYKLAKGATSVLSRILLETSATCTTYQAGVDYEFLTTPKFTDHFRKALKALPVQGYFKDVNDLAPYKTFFQTYGTHIVIVVLMGATYGERVAINARDLSYNQQNGTINLKDAVRDSVKLVLMGTTNKSETSKTFENTYYVERSAFNIGPRPPKNLNTSTWLEHIQDSPMPVRIHFDPIVNYLTSRAFPDDPYIDTRRQGIEKALSVYCTAFLLISGNVASCDAVQQRQLSTAATVPSRTKSTETSVDNKTSVTRAITSTLQQPIASPLQQLTSTQPSNTTAEASNNMTVQTTTLSSTRLTTTLNLSTRYFIIWGYWNWETAAANCGRKGARLAEVKNAKEQAAITVLSKQMSSGEKCSSGFWLGARSLDMACSLFIWEGSESELTFSNWNSRQPDCKGCQGGPPYCASIASGGVWDDIGCETRLQGAICEYLQETSE